MLKRGGSGQRGSGDFRNSDSVTRYGGLGQARTCSLSWRALWRATDVHRLAVLCLQGLAQFIDYDVIY